jgi:hypothetical protein
MGETGEVTKALFDKDVILCGKCGHVIAKCKGLRQGLGNGTIYLMCKHKSSGRTCKEINQIDL